jgi:hypothetical protein
VRILARYRVGEVFTARTRRLESPSLADKMVRRAVTRQQVEAVLLDTKSSRSTNTKTASAACSFAACTAGPYTWSWPTTTSWTRPSYSLCMSLTEPTDGILPPVFEPGWRATMSDDLHFDGGRLRRQNVSHRHVVEHDDGRVSAVVVRGVPAIACELCEESYYEPDVTDAIVDLLSQIEVAPGEAIAVDYRALTAA